MYDNKEVGVNIIALLNTINKYKNLTKIMMQ